ncbi:hypothetical protein ACS0PU_010995 [Formica fusca]
MSPVQLTFIISTYQGIHCLGNCVVRTPKTIESGRFRPGAVTCCDLRCSVKGILVLLLLVQLRRVFKKENVASR